MPLWLKFFRKAILLFEQGDALLFLSLDQLPPLRPLYRISSQGHAEKILWVFQFQSYLRKNPRLKSWLKDWHLERISMGQYYTLMAEIGKNSLDSLEFNCGIKKVA